LKADDVQPGQRIDTRAAQTTAGSNHAVEAVGALNWPKSPEGKAEVSGNAWVSGEWLKLRQTIKALNGAIRKQLNWLR